MRRLLMRGILGVSLLLVSGCGQLWGGVCVLPTAEALLVLQDVAAGGKASRLKAMTPAPRRTTIPFTVEGRSYSGDLYLPGVAPAAGIVLVPGAARLGKDDPRLVHFATTLARVRFAVLVPDMPGVRQLQVRPGDAQAVADAFSYLHSQRHLIPGGRAGMAAVSYAVGPAILAALQPAIREQVDFILGIGGYYDIVNVLTFVITGQFQEGDGPWQLRKPNPYGKWIYVLSNLDRVSDPRDRELLRQLAERRIDNPERSIEDLTSQLGPEGQQILAFLGATVPAEVPERMAQLPPALQQDIAGMNLARQDLSPLAATLILVHGKDDPIIPYTESQRLAQAAPQARLYLAQGLSHVDVGEVSFGDVLSLGCSIDALLSQRRGP